MSWQVRVKLQVGSLRLDLDLAGELQPVALIGPNGSGKTTLLRTIAGAYQPEQGRIEVGDQVLFDGDAARDLPPERRQIGYVPQGYGLWPHLRVIDNVAFGLLSRAPRPPKDVRRHSAAELLDRMGCRQLAERWPGELSAGEKQRVALARALMLKPRMLLLDEPLSALDAVARRTLRGYLAEHLATSAIPAIVVTHDVRDVLALNATVVVLEAGHVLQQGTVEAVASEPANAFVAEFFDAVRTDPGATKARSQS